MHKSYRVVWSQTKARWVVTRKALRLKAYRILFVTALMGPLPAYALDTNALPTGGQIVVGQGSISQGANAMVISQLSDRMVANWATFNIGSGAAVQFQQPGAASIALNRIFDQNPSQIFGSLTANGQIFLLNPSGIVFGSSARVDVGGLVASSLSLSDEDFLAGKFTFSGATGSVINNGTIRTADGGYVAFLSPCVQNDGSISAPGGNVSLAAGSQVSLDFSGDKLVNFTIDQGIIDALIANNGLIKADDGTVYLSAKAADSLTSSVINQSGVIEAQGLSSRGGRIVLDAAGGQTTVSGTLDASSASGQGGTVIATGERVLVKSGAHLNASGASGGGEVLVGGSWQGSNASIRQATGTVVEKGALLEANATDIGAGGTVVAWSDVSNAASVTRAYGTFEANGGVNGGNGGRIETSGHWLDVAGATGSAAAVSGLAGEWLLDPYNVTITSANASGTWGSAGVTDTWTPSADSSTILNTDINSKLEAGTNVTITTTGSGTQVGDITVAAAIGKTSGDSDVSLTLRAANSIVVNQAITNSGGTGKLNVVLDADNDGGTGDGAGIVMLNAGITTGGGNLSFGTGRTVSINGVDTLVGGDVYVAGTGALGLSTGGGTVDVKGEMIVANTAGLTIDSAGGDVHFYGLLNSGNQYTFIDKSGVGEIGSWDQARTEAINGTGGGSAVGDSYLVTITSRLENAVAVRAAGYQGAWIGAWRPNESTGAWVWANGPEAGQQFFTQTTNGSSGTTTAGYYSNFGSGEPNGSMSDLPAERVGQFFGTLGQWNDLRESTPYNEASAAEQYKVRGFIKETNLAASPLTINAGSGTVTFDGAVGTNKALKSLTVTAATTNIKGGAVTTEGLQSYDSAIALGAAATVLTQTNADTAFTLTAGKSITNATGADASLAIKTTADIVLATNSSISSSTGKLNTVLWSDTDANGGGISLAAGSSISTNNGNLVMGGGVDPATGYALGTAESNNAGIDIQGDITTGSGNVTMHGSSALGSGIEFSAGTLSSNGTVAITGETSYNANAGAPVYGGVKFSGTGTRLSTSTGTVSITGTSTAGAGKTGTLGVLVDSATLETTGSGTLTLTGTRASQGNYGWGVGLYNNALIRSTAAGGGALTLNGNSGDWDVVIQSSNVISNGGNILLNAQGAEANLALEDGACVAAGTGGNITLTADSVIIKPSSTLSGTGTLTIKPQTAGTTIGIAGGTGTLQLASSYFATNFVNGFSGITIGNATAGAITVGGATTFNDSVTLRNNAGIALNGAITANENLTLNGSGAISQTAALAVAGVTAITAGAANNITLTNTANNFGGALSVVSGANVAVVDSNALTLGAVNASGTVDIVTLTGNLTLTDAVSTADATESAIRLNAGQNAAAGTAAGGNIIVSGGSVTTGAGGRATLYSGSVSGSTGLTGLIGSGSGCFRYNSDESASNFVTVLGAGNYAIYRERPVITVAADDQTVTLGTTPTLTSSLEGLLNGDTATQAVSGDVVISVDGGSASDAVYGIGEHRLTVAGLTSLLGYELNYASGTVTVPQPVSAPDTGQIDTQTGEAGGPAAPSGPTIEPNTGSAGLGAIMNARLVVEPLTNGAAQVLTSDSQSAPVSFSASRTDAVLGVGQDFSTDNLQEIGSLAIFSRGAGATEALGNFIVHENASAISLSAVGTAGGSAPAGQDLVTATTTTFSLELASGASLECRVGISSTGVLVIIAPESVDGLDMRQVVMMGMQVLRQELKQDLGQLKSAVVLKGSDVRI